MDATNRFRIISVICLISFVMVSCSQVKKPQDKLVTPPTFIENLESQKDGEIVHLALGDSVVKGVGAAAGQNYVDLVSKKLSEQTGKKVVKINDGINGLTSGELMAKLESGQFDEQIKKANLITVNIGGNDLIQISMKEGILAAAKMFQDTKKNFMGNLVGILDHIQKINPNAKIVVLGLYNPLPEEDKLTSIAGKLLDSWNDAISDVIEKRENIAFTEIADVLNQTDTISADGVHPNENGYQAISKKVFATLKQAKVLN